MKLAIMQPYFFPYIGYFQLLNSVDKFVFYDDVNFIRSGWINRNRLFLSGSIRYVTVPLQGASSFQKINRIRTLGGDDWSAEILSTIQQSYAKAPHYKPVRALLESVFQDHDGYLSSLARKSVLCTASYLGLEKDFVLSSQIYGNQDLKSAERVLDICKIEKATEYLNLPSGRDLYNPDDFVQKNICLKFVDVSIKPYRQLVPEFLPRLSMLDVLMFNDQKTINNMLSTHVV